MWPYPWHLKHCFELISVWTGRTVRLRSAITSRRCFGRRRLWNWHGFSDGTASWKAFFAHRLAITPTLLLLFYLGCKFEDIIESPTWLQLDNIRNFFTKPSNIASYGLILWFNDITSQLQMLKLSGIFLNSQPFLSEIVKFMESIHCTSGSWQKLLQLLHFFPMLQSASSHLALFVSSSCPMKWRLVSSTWLPQVSPSDFQTCH